MNRLNRLFENGKLAECALITSDINRRYFTGMKSSAGTVLAFPDKAYLIIDFRYIEKARETVAAAEVVLQDRLFEQIAALMKKHGASSVSIEADTMTVSELARVRKLLPGARVDDSSALSNTICSLRSIKGSDELMCIRKAQEIAEKAFDDILGFIRVGATEREIALELNRLMFLYGAEDISFETIALAGKNTSMPHGVPSDKKVCEGEFVLMDFGAVYNGYHSDMTRTVCVGKPSEEMEKVYNIVLEAQLAGLAAARPGITGCELDKVSRDIIERAGYGDCFGHSLGHGVGLEIHEKPNAASSYKMQLRQGEIITVEPGIYLAGRFGVRIEDFVILTENGCDNLTKCAKNIIYL